LFTGQLKLRVVGLQLAQAMQEAIVTVGIGLAGVACAVLPDSK
jgi:hypothetical protein